MSDEVFVRPVLRLGSLVDPVRRQLYRFVAEQPDAVSRDQAAAGVDVPRHTARFHLDKLVDAGLLVFEFRRLTGRTGPGAGRPAKLYRRSHREIGVSVPARRYDLAGEMLADAVAQGLGGTPMAAALTEAARRAAAAAVDGLDTPETGHLERVAAALSPYGYEPRLELAGVDDVDPQRDADGELVLANCPFARLSAGHPEVVCRANRAFVAELVDLVADGACVSESSSAPEGCCVRVRRRGRA